MKMIRIPALAAAAMLFVSVPALAQAPISQGRSAHTAQLQSNAADLKLKMLDLEADNARLTGEIETLQFLLSQTRDEVNRMQGDDQEIARQLKSLNGRLSAMDRKIKALESRPAPSASSGSGTTYSSTEGSTSGYSTRSVTTADRGSTTTTTGYPGRRPVTSSTSSGPRALTPQGSGSTRTVTTSPQGSTGSVTRVGGANGTPPQTGSLGTISASDLPGSAGPLFAEAKSRLLQFDYAGAESAFRSFLTQFGSDPQAGEAQYWLGEVLYQQDAYAESGAAYTDMIRNYPDDERAPDALVKLARSMRLVGDAEKACGALAILPQRYPNASAVTKNLAAVEASRSACGS